MAEEDSLGQTVIRGSIAIAVVAYCKHANPS
jgi:hypothetical protein